MDWFDINRKRINEIVNESIEKVLNSPRISQNEFLNKKSDFEFGRLEEPLDEYAIISTTQKCINETIGHLDFLTPIVNELIETLEVYISSKRYNGSIPIAHEPFGDWKIVYQITYFGQGQTAKTVPSEKTIYLNILVDFSNLSFDTTQYKSFLSHELLHIYQSIVDGNSEKRQRGHMYDMCRRIIENVNPNHPFYILNYIIYYSLKEEISAHSNEAYEFLVNVDSANGTYFDIMKRSPFKRIFDRLEKANQIISSNQEAVKAFCDLYKITPMKLNEIYNQTVKKYKINFGKILADYYAKNQIVDRNHPLRQDGF